MHKKIVDKIPLWQFEQFATTKKLRHFVSGREGGVSIGDKSSLNLSYQVGDVPQNVAINRQRIANAMHIPEARLIFPQQTHSCNVKVVDNDSTYNEFEQIDGLVTDKTGICIAILAADCVPILLFDEKRGVVGAVHAGWRGTVAMVVAKAVEVMQTKFQSHGEDIKVGIGPSIGPRVYEVGEEVIEKVYNAFPNMASQWLRPGENGKNALFDLWEANKQQLIQLGIPESNIETAGICTFTNSDQFFSARASSIKGGRFGAGIMLTEDQV